MRNWEWKWSWRLSRRYVDGGRWTIFHISIRLFVIFERQLFFLHIQFHFGVKELILFDQWSIDSAGGLIASVLVIVVMAACYEGLKYYREYLFWKTYNSLQYRAVTLPEKTAVVGASNEDSTAVKWVVDFYLKWLGL